MVVKNGCILRFISVKWDDKPKVSQLVQFTRFIVDNLMLLILIIGCKTRKFFNITDGLTVS